MTSTMPPPVPARLGARGCGSEPPVTGSLSQPSTGANAAADAAADPRAWLKAAADPGRGRLRQAAGFHVLATAFAVAQWAGLAWAAEDMLARPGASVWPALLLLGGGGALAAVAAWAAARSAAAGRRQIAAAIRRRLAAGLLPAGPRRADPDPAAAALATVELADDVADYHAQAMPLHGSAPAAMAIVFAVTAVVQWPAALILLVGSLIVPANMRLAGLFAAEGADDRVAASARLSAVVLESFRGMRTLAAVGAVPRRRSELERAAGDLNASTMTVVGRALLSGAVMDMVITFAIAVDATYIGLSLLGYVRLAGAPRITLFSGLLALLLCPMYFAPLRAVAAAYHSRERAAAAVPVITGLLTEAEPPPDAGGRLGACAVGPVTVALDHVSFGFPGSARPLLADVDLTLPAGQWTAVTGPSGAGKTTLLALIAGMRGPTAGTVRWAGAVGPMPPRLGDCAWIGQRTVILPGSIADNIRIGRPHASLAEVEAAVAAAGLADVVAGLPAGLDTPLGEGGWGLSTGEARRVAIARAFLLEARLWLLDEPTAHLDPGAEAQVVDALAGATLGRTVVVATHSAQVADRADVVLGIGDATVRRVAERVPA
jgi:ATP-binding cassette, subfamily C, bacterial CydD